MLPGQQQLQDFPTLYEDVYTTTLGGLVDGPRFTGNYLADHLL